MVQHVNTQKKIVGCGDRVPVNQMIVIRSCHAHCPAPFQATATMRLPGEVTATAWLPTCDVVSARQCSYPVSDTVSIGIQSIQVSKVSKCRATVCKSVET